MLKNTVTKVNKIGSKMGKLKRNLGIASYFSLANVSMPRTTNLGEKCKNTFALSVLLRVEFSHIERKIAICIKSSQKTSKELLS